MRPPLQAFVVFAVLLAGAKVRAVTHEPVVLGPGALSAALAGGPAVLGGELWFAAEASFRVGVADGVELAAPLGASFRLFDFSEDSMLYLALGVPDLWFAPDGAPLLPWTFALCMQGRFGPEAALRALADLTGVERVPFTDVHPGWIRGATALVIDFGPYATLGAGISYQRRAFGAGDAPSGTREAGFAGDSRVSFGAVRSQPFFELPTLAVHLGAGLDIIALLRADIDTQPRTTDLRFLAGLSYYFDRVAE